MSLDLDLTQNQAMVIDNNVVLAVDLVSGNRTIVSNAATGVGVDFITPLNLGLDLAGKRLFVIDDGRDALIAVDRLSGDRIIISDLATGSGTPFMNPSGLALDLENNRAFVIDTGLNALSLVELGSGDRVIVSR